MVPTEPKRGILWAGWIWQGGEEEEEAGSRSVVGLMVGFMEWVHDWLLWDAFLECGGIMRPPIR